MILDAPYTSIADVARSDYPFLPVRLLLVDRYETDSVLRTCTMPLLILHGETRSRSFRSPWAAKLARLANEPKRLVTFPNGGHSDLYVDGNNALDPVRDWICGLAPTARARKKDRVP